MVQRFLCLLILVVLFNFRHASALSQGSSYPAGQTEDEASGRINSIIERNGIKFNSLVFNNNPNLTFLSEDSHYMTQRLQDNIDKLLFVVEQSKDDFLSELISIIILEVVRAWTDKMDATDAFNQEASNSLSLHYEGRSAQIRIRDASRRKLELLADLAISVGFDYVYFPNLKDYIVVSVVKDNCSTPLDILLILDGSGSVGPSDFDISLEFISEIADFFNISPEETQIAVVEFSSNINNVIYLNNYTDAQSLKNAISNITYRGGGTQTYKVIKFTYTSIFTLEFGMREKSAGIPRVAVFMTDGQSNGRSIGPYVEELHNSEQGIQVYSIGIGGGINQNELMKIAGDSERVFELNSFSDTLEFVNHISYISCNTPASVDEIIESEVKQGDFRYFQANCEFLANNVTIEDMNIIGNNYLYVSNQLKNPGPLSEIGQIQKIENNDTIKSITINISEGVDQGIVYISVQGREEMNKFILYIYYSSIFAQEIFTVNIREDVSIGHNVSKLNLQVDSANFCLSIWNGNDDGVFVINNETGQINTIKLLNPEQVCSYQLQIFAQNKQYSCHRGKATLKINIINVNHHYPKFIGEPYQAVIDEDYGIGKEVLQLYAFDNDSIGVCSNGGTNYGVFTYAIVGGNIGAKFIINSNTGLITVEGSLDALILDSYILTVRITDGGGLINETSIEVGVNIITSKPQFLKRPENIVINGTGREVILKCVAVGRPDPEITWTFNNVPLDATNPTQIRISNFSASNEGKYSCTARNIAGNNVADGSVTIYQPTESINMTIVNYTNESSPEGCKLFQSDILYQNLNNIIEGINLEISEIATDGDICNENCPCLNGGNCIDESCECLSGWEGEVCEVEINECNRNTDMCPPGVECINSIGGYSCMCSAQKAGRNCNIMNQCSNTTLCGDGMVCINTEDGHLCEDPENVATITTVGSMEVQDVLNLLSNNLNSDAQKREVTNIGDCKIYVERLNKNPDQFIIASQCQNGKIIPSSFIEFCRKLYSKQILDSCVIGQTSVMMMPTEPIKITYTFFISFTNGTHLPAKDAVSLLNQLNLTSKLQQIGLTVQSITPTIQIIETQIGKTVQSITPTIQIIETQMATQASNPYNSISLLYIIIIPIAIIIIIVILITILVIIAVFIIKRRSKKEKNSDTTIGDTKITNFEYEIVKQDIVYDELHPQTYPAKYSNNIQEDTWYHGKISRSEAEMRLKEFEQIGGYLVRQSETRKNAYAIAILISLNHGKPSYTHFLVNYNGEKYSITLNRNHDIAYQTLEEILDHFKKNKFSSSVKDGEATTLTYPCPKRYYYIIN